MWLRTCGWSEFPHDFLTSNSSNTLWLLSHMTQVQTRLTVLQHRPCRALSVSGVHPRLAACCVTWYSQSSVPRCGICCHSLLCLSCPCGYKMIELALKSTQGSPWLVWLSWLGHHPLHQRAAGLIPSQGTHLGCGFHLWSGHVWQATNRCSPSHQCFFLFPFLPLTLSAFPAL